MFAVERSLTACVVHEKVLKQRFLFPFYIWNITTHCIARYCVNEGIRELAPICQTHLYVRRPICKVTLVADQENHFEYM